MKQIILAAVLGALVVGDAGAAEPMCSFLTKIAKARPDFSAYKGARQDQVSDLLSRDYFDGTLAPTGGRDCVLVAAAHGLPASYYCLLGGKSAFQAASGAYQQAETAIRSCMPQAKLGERKTGDPANPKGLTGWVFLAGMPDYSVTLTLKNDPGEGGALFDVKVSVAALGVK